MMGGQEIWSICRTLGWHPISSQRHRRGENTRASFCLIHAMLGNKMVHAHARYRRDGTRSTSRGRAKGRLSDGAMAGG